MKGSAQPPPDAAARPSGAETKPIDIPALPKASVGWRPKIKVPAGLTRQDQRTFSLSSDASSTPPHSISSSLSSSLRRSSSTWVKASPTVNLHTTCGRHTDQYLFGGPSLTKMARSVMKKS
ncbi:hypothetical protein OCS_04633 [Ophiocordyceps sinensis CO18]|uniref:Uncharacterized protein n=1 Tax=Ophiocordyceps sinensis (strain Co18 / CGMCC 3.14243) TaxID=911162 RepID=T5AB80_OPHSC|nr:hypothetical protein OCS_04633 [Ophiocordyceps sinensis CO18]